MVERFVDFIHSKMRFNIILFTIIAAAMGFLGFTYMKVNPDLTGLVSKNSPSYRKLIQFLTEKSSNNILTVVLHTGGKLEKGKETLKKLMNEFIKTGYVKKVMRFDNPELFIKYGVFSGNAGEISPLINAIKNGFSSMSPTDFRMWKDVGIALGKITRYVENYEKRSGFNEYILVSPDKNAIVMNFALRIDITDVNVTSQAVETLKSISDRIEKEAGQEIDFTGSPMVTYESTKAVKRDFVFTTIFSLIAISFLLYITLGNMSGVAYLFISMVIAMSISMGMFFLVFKEINIITSFINAMILGLGIDFGVHIMTKFNHFLLKGTESVKALKGAMKETLKPSFFSALTTVSAFLTMLMSKSPAFEQMGAMASMGIAVYFIVMYIFLPSLLLMKHGRVHEFKLYDLSIRFLDFMRKKRPAFVGFLVVSLILSYFGYLNISNFWYTPPGLVPTNSESYRTWGFLEKEFPGFGVGEIALGTRNFNNLEKLTEKLKSSPYISSVTSLTTVLEGFSEKSAKEVSKYYSPLSEVVRNPFLITILRRIGIYKQTLEMLKLVKEANNFSMIINEMKKDLPMFFIKFRNTLYFLAYAKSGVDLYSNNNLKRVYDYLEKNFKGYEFLGYPALLYKLMGDMRNVISKVIIFIGIMIISIILLSTFSLSTTLKMGFVITLFTVSTFGILYFMGIRASFMTLLVIPVMFGIGVDGMIHINHMMGHPRESLIKTEKAVSVSILTTAIAFGSLAFSRGRLLREFGISVATALVMSFLLTIFVFLPMISKRRDEP